MNILTRAGRSTWAVVMFSENKWYRRWYGGRWERHWIEVCLSIMWLDMHPNRKWPEYRQPCSFGTPDIEDYPIKGLPRI